MKKLFTLLAASMLAISSVSAEDYTPWGYYLGNMETDNLGLIGAGVATLRIAIFVPGDGILAGGTVAGVNVPVADASAVTALSAWVTPTLSSDETYTQQVDLTGYADLVQCPVWLAGHRKRLWTVVSAGAVQGSPVA